MSKDRLRAEEMGVLMASVLVPASNAFNPFGPAVRVNSRLGTDNGVETLQRDTKFARALLGVRGEVLPGWELEATASSTLDDGQHPRARVAVASGAFERSGRSSCIPAMSGPFGLGGQPTRTAAGRTTWRMGGSGPRGTPRASELGSVPLMQPLAPALTTLRRV
ncbi:hypothetical protein OOZ63_26035 [Paucibacter sp. PLA-PC-4]|uniref:hypothetical protein n=1 Tax=Paucibacter sp. PLA-PC-4 TaxID=2993655 RepID=UPI00224AB814|nr:hypothetical protein [Paucibacter sp. PLA-PC-4]MCX2865293.1 hypothetical protein [Paucibacter sp. PLA-PC-4]